MENQHQIILSLGSNQGNRFENIMQCIEKIHAEIGEIVKVSKLYETPSWGFDSDDFYNCAILVFSQKEAQQVLDEVLQLEMTLGRNRNLKQGYQARKIDIDIVAFDETIIETDSLKVPHPEMQNRKFVLLPMLDLELNWQHPVFKKSIYELLSQTTDSSKCSVIQDLEFPKREVK